MGDGAHSDTDDSTLRDEVGACEVDTFLEGDAEKDAESVVQSENEYPQMRVIVHRNDLERRGKVLGDFREVDHQGSGDRIPSTRPVPITLNQVSCVCPDNKVGLQRADRERQTILVNVHDRENVRLTPRNVRSTVRRRVDLKQTLNILKSECRHDSFSANDCKPRAIFPPHNKYAIKQVFR